MNKQIRIIWTVIVVGVFACLFLLPSPLLASGDTPSAGGSLTGYDVKVPATVRLFMFAKSNIPLISMDAQCSKVLGVPRRVVGVLPNGVIRCSWNPDNIPPQILEAYCAAMGKKFVEYTENFILFCRDPEPEKQGV